MSADIRTFTPKAPPQPATLNDASEVLFKTRQLRTLGPERLSDLVDLSRLKAVRPDLFENVVMALVRQLLDALDDDGPGA